MLTLTTFIQHSFRSPSHSNLTKKKKRKRKKEIKHIQIREEVKVSLYAHDMIVNIENHKDSTQKLLKLINEFSKVGGYNINIQKWIAFLYTNNEILEREHKNAIPFKIHPKN